MKNIKTSWLNIVLDAVILFFLLGGFIIYEDMRYEALLADDFKTKDGVSLRVGNLDSPYPLPDGAILFFRCFGCKIAGVYNNGYSPGIRMAEGRFFNSEDFKTDRPVCVVPSSGSFEITKKGDDTYTVIDGVELQIIGTYDSGEYREMTIYVNYNVLSGYDYIDIESSGKRKTSDIADDMINKYGAEIFYPQATVRLADKNADGILEKAFLPVIIIAVSASMFTYALSNRKYIRILFLYGLSVKQIQLRILRLHMAEPFIALSAALTAAWFFGAGFGVLASSAVLYVLLHIGISFASVGLEIGGCTRRMIL